MPLAFAIAFGVATITAALLRDPPHLVAILAGLFALAFNTYCDRPRALIVMIDALRRRRS